VQALPEALSIYINQLVCDRQREGVDVITLSLGEAFFDIPMFDFKKLDFAKGYHYSDSRGIPELRKKIADYYQEKYGATVNPKDELLITAGSKSVIFLCMQATLNAGDEVLMHEPAWLSYQEQVRLVDAIPNFMPFDVKPERFHEYFTDKTKMIILNSPNNPAGWVYSKEHLILLCRQCRSRGIYLLLDEAYSDYVMEDEFVSLASLVQDKEGFIVVNSLSKNMGMSGWRVGYVISSPKLICEVLKLNQHILTCGPTILLYYLTKYFDQIIDITLPQVKELVRKRKRVAAFMEEIGLHALEGGATFYFFVNIDNFPGSSLEFSLDLLINKGIAVVPGTAYGDSTSRFVRLSIGAESEERITEALLVMKDLIETTSFDSGRLYEKMYSLNLKVFREVRRDES
jgi:aspartate/methionine/tyrosine aminotransferase